ncbi:translocation/assembly module TamB domain-containing protein [Aquabacterium sp.]|uniref:translocation/assembly module TamB domain-containing protein n=1 Tax=Aquabacterium sp. TaxID=1872578 RepID=UPI0035B46918
MSDGHGRMRQVGRVVWRTVLGLLAAGGLAIALTAGAAWWILRTPGGTAQVLDWLPGVRVVAPSGALLGDFAAARIEIDMPRGGRLTLLEPSWSKLSVAYDPGVLWQFGLRADRVQAREVELKWVSNPVATPAQGEPALSVPFSLDVKRVEVGRFASNLLGTQTVAQLVASLRLQRPSSAVGGRGHSLQLTSLDVAGWHLQGQADLGVHGLKQTQLNLKAQQQDGGTAAQVPVGAAVLSLRGPLSQLSAQGAISLTGGKTGAQSLSWQGELAPFAAWPVHTLSVQSQGLDLARVWPEAPRTAVTGQIQIIHEQPKGSRTASLHGVVHVRNPASGPWDAGRVPLTQLDGDVWLDSPSSLAGTTSSAWWQKGCLSARAVLPSPDAKARLELEGPWNLAVAGQTRVQARLTAIDLKSMDGRAPPLRVGGELRVQPDAAQDGHPNWQKLSVVAQLSGVRTDSSSAVANRPVSADLDGSWTPGEVLVRQLRLLSGGVQARVTGKVLLPPQHPVWQVQAQVDLKEFDPLAWLPSTWLPPGPHRLQGSVRLDVDGLLQGQASAHLDKSMLSGLALDGSVNWVAPAGRADMSVQSDLKLAGNRFTLAGDVPVQRQAGQVRWSAQRSVKLAASLQAPVVGSWQPLLAWLGWRDVQGQLAADVGVEGVWPAWRVHGNLHSDGLKATSPQQVPMELSKTVGQWDWQMASSNAPVSGSVNLSAGRVGNVRLNQFVAQLSGSAASHRLKAQGDVQLSTTSSGAHPRTTVRAAHLDWLSQGGWLGGGVLGWRGEVSHLQLRTVERKPQDMLVADTMPMSWRLDEQALNAQVGASALNLAGAQTRVKEFVLSYPRQGGGIEQSQINLAMEITPFALADVLARWQPQAGWGGDLMVAGHVQLVHRPGESWQADGRLERQSGDLSLSEPSIQGNTRQSLGIKVAVVSLTGRQGVWSLSQQFEGRVLGTVKGAQQVVVKDPSRLPAGGDAVSGALDLNIGNLRPWGVWMPAGWRLGGQVQAHVAMSGTLMHPGLTGSVKGQALSVGNALLGVNLADGVLDLSLDGDHVTLTQLAAHGASDQSGGLVSVTGDARLGASNESPQVKLNVRADRFALLQRIDRRALVSGQGVIEMGEDDLKVDGQFTVDEGLVDISRSDAPTLGDDVNVINRPGEVASDDAAQDVEAAQGAKRKLQVNLTVDLGSKLQLKGRGLETLLAGHLRLTTPNGRPALNGVVRTVSGKYAAYGQKLTIDHGSITFNGPVENPRLDILALRPQSPSAQTEVKVGVQISGTAQEPRVRLYSDTSMSETEKLSWLVLGRGPAGLAGADIGLLQTAASALLVGENGSPKDSVLSAIGLDTLSVQQKSSGDVQTTVVNVGKQISRHWYVGYERSLNATTGSWQLVYRLAQRVTLRAQAGEDNALDLIWSWRFN